MDKPFQALVIIYFPLAQTAQHSRYSNKAKERTAKVSWFKSRQRQYIPFFSRNINTS